MIFLAALALIASTPATLTADLKAAKGGDTLTLAAGDYGAVTISARKFAPPLSIDATDARFTNFQVKGSSGVYVTGGSFTRDPKVAAYLGAIYVAGGSSNVVLTGPQILGDGVGMGVVFRDSTDVAISDARVDRAATGILVLRVTGATLRTNTLLGFAVDGIDVYSSHQVLVEGNGVMGGLRVDDHHPDAIQSASYTGEVPTSDLVIRANVVYGNSIQGISLFDHGTGGFDRVIIEDNVVQNGFGQSLAAYATRDSIVRNNIVRSMPGATGWSRIVVMTPTNIIQCGNLTGAGAGKAAISEGDCP